METVLIVIHLIVVLALVGVVLLQRSEGGGLGIGGGSGFMTARGAANALTRTTAILATAFFVTSLALSILARYGERPADILDRVPAQGEQQKEIRRLLELLTGAVDRFFSARLVLRHCFGQDTLTEDLRDRYREHTIDIVMAGILARDGSGESTDT